jgi:hypothetical protein
MNLYNDNLLNYLPFPGTIKITNSHDHSVQLNKISQGLKTDTRKRLLQNGTTTKFYSLGNFNLLEIDCIECNKRWSGIVGKNVKFDVNDLPFTSEIQISN